MASPVKRESCDVSRELMHAIAREGWTEVNYILSKSSRHVADSVVTQLINEDQWSAVRQIIKCVGDEERTWDIGGVLVKNNILLSVVDRDWTCLKESPNTHFPDSTFQWIIRQACTRATDIQIVLFVLPHCADDRQDSVLTILVERRLWQAVGEVLVRGVSDSMKQWTVREACKHCQCEDFGMFDFHSSVYYQCYQRVHVTVEQFLISDILRHCADDQLNSVLTTLVERRLWQAVGVILTKKGVSDSNKQWAVQEACKHCKDYGLESLIQNILPHSADDQLNSVLTTLVERRLWQAVGVILKKKGVSDSNKQWAVKEACKHCYNNELESLIQNILPHCAVDQLDSVVTTLVERRLWQAVLYVLEHGVSDFYKRWVVLEMCAYCESVSQEQKLSDILLFYADNQLGSVLTTLVERCQWLAVGKILKKGVSDSNKQWAVPRVCKQPTHNDFRTDNTYWRFRSESDQELYFPTEQCLVDDILPHCADNQLHSVLTPLVERRVWRAVLYVLQRGVSDFSKRWVVLEVCACCEFGFQDHTLSDILLFCADDQADCVLTTLVERRLWRAVGQVLKKGVSDSNKQWAVREAWTCFTQYHFRTDDTMLVILRHYDDNQLESVLTTLLGRHLSKPVGEILQRGGSDRQRRWAVEEAIKNAEEDDFVQCILPFCSDQYLDSVLSNLVKRRMWKSVGELLQQGVGKTQRRWAVEEASKAAESEPFVMYVLPSCSNQHLRIVPHLVENGLWDYVQQILHCTAKHFLCQLVKQEGHTIKDDSVVWAIPNNCHLNAAHAVKLFGVAKKETASKVHELHTWLCLKEDVCDLLYTSYIHQVCFELFSEEKTAIMTDFIHSLVLDIYLEIISCIQTISTNSVKDIVDYVKSDACKITSLVSQLGKLSSSAVPLCYSFLKQFSLYCTCRHGNADDDVFLMMFAVLPLVPEMQSVALRIMLRHKRWDVISHADLSGVWEQDRRHLLQAAVKQRQWSVVKRWADHTLYDDQRVWALNEALNEKQWNVALLLADHGLTDIDRMRVHYRLAKYEDCDVILHMFERGADVAEVRERLGRMKDNKRIAGGIICCIDDRYSKMKNFEKEIQMANLVAKYADLAVILHMFERGADVAEVRERLGRMKDYKRIPENIKCCIDDRCSQVEDVEKEIQKAKLKALETACRSCNWISVLFILIRNPSKESVYSALTIATKKKAWHVVMQLVRLGIDAKQRHSLFFQMMKRQQWGVCRVLLEQGLRVQLCLKVLPKLMEMNQWTLVARVMEHDVGDDVRQQVMQRAWERREGSVVWLCIKSLPTPLSEEEREALFQRAFSCELWQVIKPLVEEKDETGIRHRDTALLEAIEQHQWDLVDHCQRHHADINMKDDDGHTPLQRAAMKKDWEAVEELVVRDGDPNLLDREGNTVLHRAIEAQQWVIVDLLIQYHADIHKEYNSWYGAKGVTPLRMLIDARQGNIIERTLLWCPDQSKGLNILGETTLHVACLSGCYDSLYYLVARGVNPSAVTYRGQSSLVHAVLYKRYPQRMVAECIRLGFSTHQPKLTNIEVDLTSLTSDHPFYQDLCSLPQSVTSPSLCAVLRGLPVVMLMLYESGACSQRELFRLYTELPKLADPNTVKGRKLQERAGHNLDAYKNFVHRLEDIALPYLTDIATTPRSLESTCRLVISHCLTLSKTRHRDVDQLPLPERMKNFVMFSDLTDPDFGKDTT